ncbi:putative IQ motif and SEC7 domain-containing protein 3 [Triplophysa rosa]|uniref:IQ motif and SEC7 domain-containing protein 3 n=1 Tax=Triplophysa rosa TaxID=992332 RepID=A0A9W7T8F8_TRIRA|nr:putative IQ motif and SEC7 domain-containing protein 3 [Triplophysa rosa]
MLEHKYGGHLISRRAACKIQTAFRQYQLSKNFEKIRNSLLESRLPRRISLRKVRVQNTEGISAERALAEGCNLASIPLVRSPSLPNTVGGTLTDLEDSFNEQVQSLAKSIDDALSNWSMKTMCSLQENFGTVGGKSGMAGTEGVPINPVTLQSGTIPADSSENVTRSASKLMMAFRDVTVQIDSQNFRMSSSVMESSTSVSLGNCVQQGATITESLQQSPVYNAKEQPLQGQPLPPPPPQDPAPAPLELDAEEVPDGDFPAPPPSEEELGEEPSPLVFEKKEYPEATIPAQTVITSDTLSPPEVAEMPDTPTVEVLEAKHIESDLADNSSEQMSSSSTSTSARSASEVSSKEALQAMILSLPRYHCENPVSCKSPTLSTDVMRKRLYRIGLNLFNIKCVNKTCVFFSLLFVLSQRYCMCNPDVVQQFHNPDTIFILAFAIILLNTDMYSPNIKPDRKMMLEDFIRNLRGVDDGADIPRDMVVGIYERIQQRELRSNEDHVTYVTKVEQSIVGMKTVLSVPHRRLVCCSRLFEVTDINKAQKQAAHQREVFLFNDLLVMLKLCPKKKSTAAYTFCKAMGLLGMQFHLFENEYYPHAITIVSPCSGSDKKQVLNFCAQSAEELLKFIEDLKESIAEVSEMEQIRIECKQEVNTLQGGHNAVEVSIHNRLQTYQLNAAPPSPESAALLNHQRELFQQPPLQCASPTPVHSHQPVALAEIRPDTLIQCQQIVKVIVLDKGGNGRMEAFLSQSPTRHQLIQSVVSTLVHSPDGGSNQGGKDGSQPPLPPPPPPYNHPHQYIPPDPRLALQRTASGSRSLM